MSRPKRTSIDLICDIFADLSPEQQDGILITLQALHRQAKRRGPSEHYYDPARDGVVPVESRSCPKGPAGSRQSTTPEELEPESDLERDRR